MTKTPLDPATLAKMCDSTNLRLDASIKDIEALCLEAVEFGLGCVMVYPTTVPLVRRVLEGSDIRIGTVVGFPSGRFSSEAKVAEIAAAAAAGAHEVDVVMNYAALKEGAYESLATKIALLVSLAHEHGLLIKVIAETCYLTENEKLKALSLCEDAGVDFIKTSTGFGSGGATVEDVALWAKNRKGTIGIKASGGIRTLEDALGMIEVGATRLGTSNAAGIVRTLTEKLSKG